VQCFLPIEEEVVVAGRGVVSEKRNKNKQLSTRISSVVTYKIIKTETK